ncbi:PHP domain-containing protein [Gallaecimonas sp. GXIMD4217]|uniref:RNase RNM n=1 Tax=Gallaecimonas sp. GXIMD4217 TaxID=3131927 RepID=UPI00311ABEA8
MITDLHSHTVFSDGKLTPQALIDRAIERRVSRLAITDHDTTDALAVARAHIHDNELPLELVPGVEISCQWGAKEVHVVGLWVDEDCQALMALLAQQKQRREERAVEIGRRLEKAKIPDALAGARRHAGTAAITRAHFAQYLVELGKASTVGAVFKKYLSRGNTGYVPPNWVPLAEAIAVIHRAGGKAVLAHPGRYQLSGKWLRKLVAEFAEAGGDAMEVAQCQQPQNERRFLADLAAEHHLKASQGSDFHFPSPFAELGRNLYLPAGALPVWE